MELKPQCWVLPHSLINVFSVVLMNKVHKCAVVVSSFVILYYIYKLYDHLNYSPIYKLIDLLCNKWHGVQYFRRFIVAFVCKKMSGLYSSFLWGQKCFTSPWDLYKPIDVSPSRLQKLLNLRKINLSFLNVSDCLTKYHLYHPLHPHTCVVVKSVFLAS